MQSPIIVVITGLIEEDLTISGLFPVARIESPSFVLSRKVRNKPTKTTATNAIIRVCLPSRAVPSSFAFRSEKTVSELLRLRSDDFFITAILIE